MARYVEKIPVSVRVSRAGEEPVQGCLVLAPQARDHDGPETLLDLLNSPARVIPLLGGEGEHPVLLGRLGLDWVMPGPDAPAELVCPRNYMVTREERVEVRFQDGRRLEGLIQMELPQEYNRTSDFLNGPGDFFPLVTPWGTLLVNKSAVGATVVFESSPAPLEAQDGRA